MNTSEFKNVLFGANAIDRLREINLNVGKMLGSGDGDQSLAIGSVLALEEERSKITDEDIDQAREFKGLEVRLLEVLDSHLEDEKMSPSYKIQYAEWFKGKLGGVSINMQVCKMEGRHDEALKLSRVLQHIASSVDYKRGASNEQ